MIKYCHIYDSIAIILIGTVYICHVYDTRSKNTKQYQTFKDIAPTNLYVDISVVESGRFACYRGRRTPCPQISNNGKGLHRRWHKCTAICILIGAGHGKCGGMNHFLLLPHCPSTGIRAFCVGLYLSPGKLTHTLAVRVSSSFVTHRAFSRLRTRVLCLREKR